MDTHESTSRSLSSLRVGVLALLAVACSSNPRPQSASPFPDTASIGYGTMPRERITGAVSSLSDEQFRNTRAVRVEDLLRGRVAGLQVIPRGNGEVSIRIRGAGSFYNPGEPLFVIDGVPIRQHGITSALSGIAPADVARIDVLKDAGSTAIYGARGANGVIIITTRQRR